ncbi:MAG: DUF368 domain-containing protein [Clostridiales bacterium]|nr:DUF368 domain-containing protein [Clostridiales bacterium]
MKKLFKGMKDWLLRLLKGAVVGTGFILPGVSGGALAAIFGLYRRLVAFLAHITKDFWKNLMYFLPVGIGALLGIAVIGRFLAPVIALQEGTELFVRPELGVPAMWFFIGAILGTAPALWREAGEEGRKPRHYIIMAVTAVLGSVFLFWAKGNLSVQLLDIAKTGVEIFFVWVFAGFLIALGFLIPGLSPSNFLLYFGIYDKMSAAFGSFEWTLIPLFLGVILCMVTLTKLVDWILKKAYAGMFHFVCGIVIASTLMIIPYQQDYNYLRWQFIFCVLALAVGIALGWWMSRLESKYKKSDS